MELSSSIFGNLEPVFSFRVGPDDASKIAGLLSSVDGIGQGRLNFLPDYSCTAGKRPHGEEMGSFGEALANSWRVLVERNGSVPPFI